ncbi:MAG: HAD family phosphatase [Lachnospiraceae bacterium]|nr:HAD family phosphatase [Lachnospiraceae bacterium]
MINTIIFDIGKVLIGFDPDIYIKRFEFDPEEEAYLSSSIFGGAHWQDLDLGIKPFEQIREEIAASVIPSYRDDALRVFDQSFLTISKKDYTIPWIRSLQARGLQTYYLSNYSRWMIDRSGEALDFLPLMHGGLFSCEAGLIKPDPAIFQAFLARYPQVVPDESVFLDDSPRNVEAALALGFHGIVFKNHEQAVRELEVLLGADRS